MLAACLIAGATTTGCGDGDGADLATLTPPDVPLYLELVVRPDGDQAEAITSFSERLAGISDPGERLAAAVDDQLADNDVELSYAEDVEPWLGEHAALFVRSFEAGPAAAATPDFALILEAADADAAGSFVDRVAELDPATARMRSHAGVDYYALGAPDGAAIGLVENAVVVGTEMSLRVAVDAADGQSLAESEEHAARAAALGEDLLATASLDPAAVLEAATTSGDVARADLRPVEPLLDGPLSEPIAIGLSATPETATADFVAMVDDRREIATDVSLLEPLPGDSWLAAGMPDFGPTLRLLLDKLSNGGIPGGSSIVERLRNETGIDLVTNLSAWVGDAAGFARGTAFPGLSAGVIAEASDPRRARASIDLLEGLAERQTGLRSAGPPAGTEHGFSLGLPSLGRGVEAGVAGDRVAAAFGGTVAEALDPEQPLGESERFRSTVEALGEGFSPGFYLDPPGALAAARASGAAAALDDPAAAALAAIELVSAGSRLDDHLGVTRVTATLAEQED